MKILPNYIYCSTKVIYKKKENDDTNQWPQKAKKKETNQPNVNILNLNVNTSNNVK